MWAITAAAAMGLATIINHRLTNGGRASDSLSSSTTAILNDHHHHQRASRDRTTRAQTRSHESSIERSGNTASHSFSHSLTLPFAHQWIVLTRPLLNGSHRNIAIAISVDYYHSEGGGGGGPQGAQRAANENIRDCLFVLPSHSKTLTLQCNGRMNE